MSLQTSQAFAVPGNGEHPSRTSRLRSRLRSTWHTVSDHTLRHTGVGIVCAVAYFDPGNWGVDLQAGSQFGYKLLFVVLLSGIFAVFLQILASRLGCVTGRDLASHCRLLLHDRPKHTLVYRWLLLYPLYALSEIAIIATDLAELLGSGIALCLLFPKLPLWAGVLITASDVLVFLALKDPLGGRPVRLFELIIAGMVFTVLVCMAVIISQVGVHWGHAFDGFLPSSTLFKSGGLYTSIGIIGATVMPHSIFLGSALATQDRISTAPEKLSRMDTMWSVDSDSTTSMTVEVVPWYQKLFRKVKKEALQIKEIALTAFRIEPIERYAGEPRSHAEHRNHSYSFVRAHLYHGMIDIAISLLGIAVVINALILILASAVFYYGAGAGSGGPASLFDAYDLLRDIVGQGAATLFALALLASGQSSSIIATMAGQTVSEGFLRWRISPIFRRLITRLLGLVPSMAVAIAAGRDGIDTLLVASQVALSIVLPFIIFPLLILTSSHQVMSVQKLREEDNKKDDVRVGMSEDVDPTTSPSLTLSPSGMSTVDVVQTDLEGAVETVSYANGRVVNILGWTLFVVIVAANVYAIVTLGLGQG